jgi:hypothetical protein
MNNYTLDLHALLLWMCGDRYKRRVEVADRLTEAEFSCQRRDRSKAEIHQVSIVRGKTAGAAKSATA